MNLAVFGATGGVGREVVTQALDRGDHVTAYVRNPAKLDLAHPDLTVTGGDLTDAGAVQRAVHGADAVISALGPSLDRKATGAATASARASPERISQASSSTRRPTAVSTAPRPPSATEVVAPVPCQGNWYPIGTRPAADALPRRCSGRH